jgi:hypothetical protein
VDFFMKLFKDAFDIRPVKAHSRNA